MNTEEYIASGVLELYAAGVLPAEEAAELERQARLYPEIQAELDSITETLDRYAEMHAVTPPAHLKSKILQAATRPTAVVRPLHPTETQRASENIPADTGKFVSMPVAERAESNSYRWLVAAAVSLLILSNALSIYFYRNWKNTEERLQLAMVSQQQYAQNFDRVNQKLSQNQQQLAVLSKAETKRVVLKGVEKSPQSAVTVYWHQSTKNVMLAVNNLPAPPAGQQYQLWALVNGKPVDAGLLAYESGSAEMLRMKEIGEAQAFAITLEPQGGSVNPTLEQMYVMGTI